MRYLGILLLTAATLCAQRPMTVAEVNAFIKSQIKMKGDDRADRRFSGAQRIKHDRKAGRVGRWRICRVQGAGPKTVPALNKLSEESAGLQAAPPPQAAPAPPPPIPPPDSVEQAAVLAAMKDYALNYTNNLPNYVCVQTTRRISPRRFAATCLMAM